MRQIRASRRMRPASRTSSRPLTSSTPMLSRPTVGRSMSNRIARHRAAHHRHVDQVLGVGADRGAEVEHDRFAAQRRPERGDRRPLDPGHRLQVEFRHRHQRAGVAGRDRDIGLALLHRVDGEPHRRLPAPVAQRLARLVVHPDRDVGMDDPRRGLEPRMRVEQRLDRGPVAEQDELGVGVARQRQRRRREPPRTAHGRRPWRRARCGPSGHGWT